MLTATPDFLEMILLLPAHVEIVEISDSFYVCLVRLNVFDKKISLKDTMFFKSIVRINSNLTRPEKPSNKK
jgi:hypothetical protein